MPQKPQPLKSKNNNELCTNPKCPYKDKPHIHRKVQVNNEPKKQDNKIKNLEEKNLALSLKEKIIDTIKNNPQKIEKAAKILSWWINQKK
jgi:hypothetical protein